MPKISKIIKKQPKRASIPVDSNVSIDVERDGDIFRIYYKGSKVSEAGGAFAEWCFTVEDYNICFSREELEVMLSER